jgi:hypothetical protein
MGCMRAVEATPWLTAPKKLALSWCSVQSKCKSQKCRGLQLYFFIFLAGLGFESSSVF